MNGVVKEESILVEVILGLLLSEAVSLGECLTSRLAVLELIIVFVLGSRGVLANVLTLGKFTDEDLSLIVTLALSEGEGSGCCLDRQGQLAEGCVRLL